MFLFKLIVWMSPLIVRLGEIILNALIVLVFYFVAATLFVFGCVWKDRVVIPEEFQLPLILTLIVYGLIMATWVAVRARVVPASADADALKAAAGALQDATKALKGTASHS